MGLFSFKRRHARPVTERPGVCETLAATPGNSIPGQPSVSVVLTEDDVALRVARWRPTSRKVRGTVLLLQGRAEFIEKYFETIAELRRRGFHVVTFDWRGQGGSERLAPNRRLGHVPRFSHYRRDVVAVMKEVVEPHTPEPRFALAHSTGAAILLDMAHDGLCPVKRMVLVSPLIDIARIEDRMWPHVLAATLRAIGRGRRFIPGGGETALLTKPFDGNRLSSDPVRYARNSEAASTNPHLAVGEPSISWLAGVLALVRRFRQPRYALEVLTPTLVVAAGADEVVSTPAIERFCARLKAGHALILPGARHEILMERDEIRQDFWAAFDAFVPGLDAAEPAVASPRQKRKRLSVDAPVAGSDDRAAASG